MTCQRPPINSLRHYNNVILTLCAHSLFFLQDIKRGSVDATCVFALESGAVGNSIVLSSLAELRHTVRGADSSQALWELQARDPSRPTQSMQASQTWNLKSSQTWPLLLYLWFSNSSELFGPFSFSQPRVPPVLHWPAFWNPSSSLQTSLLLSLYRLFVPPMSSQTGPLRQCLHRHTFWGP